MIDLLVTEEIKEKLVENPGDVESIIESTDEIGICITNEEMKFAAVNDAYCKLYGYQRGDLVGNEFLMIVPPENHETMKLLHDKFMEDKREISREWTVSTKNGPMKISVDTAYSDKILGGKPHKITFVSKES